MYWNRLRSFFRNANLGVWKLGEPHFMVTPQIAGTLRELNYLEQWQVARSRGWFHMQLEDLSLLIFSDLSKGPSYSYMQSPIDAPSCRQYLASQGVDYRQRHEYLEEYALVIATAAPRLHPTPIRFDYSLAGYRAGVHPAAHIHVGLDNEMRIAVSHCLSPESFLLLVMRQMYPVNWERLLERSGGDLNRVVRRAVTHLPDGFWAEADRIELHLA